MSAKKRGRKMRMKNRKDKIFIKSVVGNMTKWLDNEMTTDGWMRRLLNFKNIKE